MSTILIKNGIIVTLGEEGKVLYDSSLLIENDTIKKIGPSGEFTGEYTKVIDATGKVVMPGFINAHMHFYSTMVRGLGKAKPSKTFVDVLENLWWRLDKKLTVDDVYYSALLPLIDSVKRGTTTLIDHHASPYNVRGSLEKIASAVKKIGLRASLCYELSDRDGSESAAQGIAENAEFIKKTQTERDPQLKSLFGLHASFTISDDTLHKAAALGKELGSGFHVHAAEANSDEQYNEQHFGMRVIERFAKFGILGPKTILAHCVHINDNEIQLIKDTDTAVVHNPQSNMNNAVGTLNLAKFADKGIIVGLGTDAMTVNMLEELRVALWVQHLSQQNPSCAFMECANTLLNNNRKIAARHWEGMGIGALKAGNVADIILMDYYPPTPFDENTLYGHIIFGLAQSFVDTTIASGKVLMENKKLTIDIDEAEIAAKSMELSAKLWERF